MKNYRLIFLILCSIWQTAQADLEKNLSALQRAYPTKIQAVNQQFITWTDGTKMQISPKKNHSSPSLYDQLTQSDYPRGKLQINPMNDAGRIRYEPFFRKMYGDSFKAVQQQSTEVYWLPKYFGQRYPLEVTRVNQINHKIFKISQELEILIAQHPDYLKFLDHPGGTLQWRTIANTQRLSSHSFGIAFDINTKKSQYWQWDLADHEQPVNDHIVIQYKNTIPWAIVRIFEKYGFIWGGKWYHYDTMHFEYRPELLIH